MEGSFLSPAEQRYYPELFSRSDSESSGRVAAQRAINLFRLSPQLSDDVIQKINELCGAARLGYYGRSQFYCALKMIAMVQNGLPLPSSVDFVMQARIEVPLPEFGEEVPKQRQQQGETDASSQMEFVNPAFNITDSEFTLGDRKGSTLASVPPLLPTRPSNSNAYIQPQTAQSPTNIAKVPSSPPVSPRESPPSSQQLAQSAAAPGAVSPARSGGAGGSLERNQSLPTSLVLDSLEGDAAAPSSSLPGSARLEKQASAPTGPTLAQTEEGWASFEKTVDEDTCEDSSWARFPSAVSPSSSCSSVSAPASSHHTSESPIDSRSGVADSQEGDVEEDEDDEEDEEEDEEGEDGEEEEEKTETEDEEDVWRVNNEQRAYYTNQFKMLQPDPTGLLPGGDAKGFFEKSKLATEELSKIWQLSDVNKDGTLSLEEFCTAMHLVVLRKHNIPLPDELPSCLIPKMPEFFGEGIPLVKQTTPVPIPGSHPQQVTTTTIHPIQPHAHTGRSVTPPSSGSEMKNADDNWATFVDSPFPGPPSPSSQPPVSFDFASISPDPDAKIFQPIALHLSPDGKPVQPEADSSEFRPRTFSDPVHQDEADENSIVAPSPIKPRAMTITSSDNTNHTPAKIAPPPEWDSPAAPPCQTVGETAELIAPRPRNSRNRSSQPQDNRSYSGATPGNPPQVARLPLNRQQAINMDESRRGLSRSATLPRSLPTARGQQQAPPPQPASSNHMLTHDETSEPPVESAPHSGSGGGQSRAATLPRPRKPKAAPLPHPSKSDSNRGVPHTRAHTVTIPPRHGEMSVTGGNFPAPIPIRTLSQAPTSNQGPVEPQYPVAKPRPNKQGRPLQTARSEGEPPMSVSGDGAQGGAPPLPPRNQASRSRSNSLDLNIVFQGEKSSSVSSPRPVIPPRPTAQQVQQSKTLSMDITSMEHDFADFSKFEAMKIKSSSLKIDRRGVSMDYNSRNTEHTFPPIPPPRPSASEEDLVDSIDGMHLAPEGILGKERHLSGDAEDAEKRREQFSKERTRHMSAPVPLGVAEIRTGDRKSVQARIRQEKEENTKLSRHNSEMQQELRTLTDQRLALEINLERLRPFTNAAS